MLIACICVIAVFIIFITATYFATRKTYSFEFDGKIVRVSNAGSLCKIFVDNILTETYHMPQLIKGETFKAQVGDKEIVIKCKTNSFGNKFSVQAYNGEELIFDNKVTVK